MELTECAPDVKFCKLLFVTVCKLHTSDYHYHYGRGGGEYCEEESTLEEDRWAELLNIHKFPNIRKALYYF